MTVLAWILIIALSGLLYACISFINKHHVNGKPSIELRLTIAFTSILVGILSGFVFFIPVLFIVFSFMPNTPHNGHVSMPMGQALLSILVSIILGVTATIITYYMILRQKTRRALPDPNLP